MVVGYLHGGPKTGHWAGCVLGFWTIWFDGITCLYGQPD